MPLVLTKRSLNFWMPEAPKKRGRPPKPLQPEPTAPASERRWRTYVRFYNKHARALGAPRITTLATIAAGDPGPFLSDEEVARLKLDHFAHLIDVIDDLARDGFKKQKRYRDYPPPIQTPSPIKVLIKKIARNYEYAGWTPEECWPVLLGFDGDGPWRITEKAARAKGETSLTWRNGDSGADGVLPFSTFKTYFYEAKRLAGTKS